MPTTKTFDSKSADAWRKWLQKNHATEKGVFVLIRRKGGDAGIDYEDAICHALCFGWIDGVARRNDAGSFYLYYTPRKPKSKWSRKNRDRVAQLTKQNLIQPAGQAMIDLAKKSGTWLALEDAQNAVIPADLQKLLNKNKTALKNFTAFSLSSKRMILEWIMNAKKPETRERRLNETVELAEKNVKAQHPKLIR